MCSIQEDDQFRLESKSELNTGRVCMKCQNLAVVVIRVNDAFCRECFLKYCTHKFRSAFGKSKLIRDGDAVLVAVSGGQATTALVHLIQEGLSCRAQKKLRFNPTLVYIDEGAVINESREERLKVCSKMAALFKATSFPFHIIPFEKVMKESLRYDSDSSLAGYMESLTLENSLANQLRDLLDSTSSLTAKENLQSILRRRLLISLAEKLSISKVMTGETSTHLASQLLSSISQGRGKHVSDEMSFSDGRNQAVMFVRPLREFSSKETALYNRMMSLEPCIQPTLTTKTGLGSSIDRLTQSFVATLQAGFPSTVSTIFRTGEKLSSELDKNKEDDFCIMCQSVLDTDTPESSALSATLFSQKLSSVAVPGEKMCKETSGEENCCGEGDGSCKSTNKTGLDKEDLLPLSCYGCRLILREMSSTTCIPGNIIQEAEKRIRRSAMKSSIQGYLLEDE
ncbi:unnamed protein product [Owenia fusiformis]|uniref:Cytoplasmic tRNA 2-thiolation protein 2 n=1 Tax=Owenia fusiformis TaxID=6347 RepID=A0A8J1Y9S2_OWEFU|nr:unnamed protein product [Owenia fusiformis]